MKTWFNPKIVFIVFLLVAGFASYVHEPWFDEVQAWQIAKAASLHDLLWVLPHYEGHPPFYHLLLIIPARLGLSGFWTLHILGFVISSLCAYLVLFKSPFKPWVRCAIVFSYFFFYQYGVIVRPYHFILLLVILLAIIFPEKDKHPFKFTALLALLCTMHLFGIMLAGGITAAWIWEIGREKGWPYLWKAIGKDKRFYCFGFLLLEALALAAWIVPTKAWSPDMEAGAIFIKRLLYILFGILPDNFITDVYFANFPLSNFYFGNDFFCACGIGLFLWYMVFSYLPKKYWAYCILPYGLIALVMNYYCSRHHIGIGGLVLLFVFWIALEEGPLKTPSNWLKSYSQKILILLLGVSCFWTLYAVVGDVRYPFYPGKEIVSFLKQHDFFDSTIMTGWVHIDLFENRFLDNCYINESGTEISFYANKNIVFNLNTGENRPYKVHKNWPGTSEMERAHAVWRSEGLPDVLIGNVPFKSVFNENFLFDKYEVVAAFYLYNMWKPLREQREKIKILVRKDLMKKHHLTPLRNEIMVKWDTSDDD